MAKFCAHCGNQLTEEEKFCPVCGTPVEQSAAPAQPDQQEKGATQPAPQPKAEGADQKAADGKKTDKSFGKITGTDVRLRAGAGTNTDIVDYFDEGEKVEITGRKDNWYRVKRDNGQTGYVSVQFCRRL